MATFFLGSSRPCIGVKENLPAKSVSGRPSSKSAEISP